MARKILLADDSVTAQNMGRKILADAGYEVITVNNGSAALKRIGETRPDLIVLDVYMPGYSGLEVCQRLKEGPETSRIPVLLTVGKLEPFKPEEAKRVRAEGFIVKPFEASELLSALSKLEDKVVPRSEPSKTGRFARAIAAVEHSNRERSETEEEASGWKNRITFPSKKKKKEKEQEDEDDDSALYNAVNRDLRTVVAKDEPAAASAKEDEAKPAESTVDVSAVVPAGLASESLPKDVTQEEIAAIAAAAAQVQDAAADSKADSEAPAKAVASETPSVEQKGEGKAESETVEVPPATLAEHKAEEKVEAAEAAVAEKKTEEKKEDQKDTRAIPGESEMVAAITALESGRGKSWSTGDSGDGAGLAGDETVELPVSLALAAREAGPAAGRWTAVPAAMDASESAISLEQEMQRAQAAAVSAETAAASSAGVEAIPAAAAEPVARVATREESELAHALSAAASAAAEAVKAAVTELATMAASHFDSTPPAPASEIAQQGPSPEVKEQPQVMAMRAPAEEASTVTAREAQPAEPAAPAAEAPPHDESAAGGTAEMTEKKETEAAGGSAAAWASWRQIRPEETKSEEQTRSRKDKDEEDEPGFAAEAAMAAAAGAEKSPEGASASDPTAIANIVDSVLADLRPKIVEEIAKKLGKK